MRDKIIGVLVALFMLHEMPALGSRYPAIIYALLIVVLFVCLCTTVGYKKVMLIVPIFSISILDVLINTSVSPMILMQQISMLLQTMILPLTAIYIYKYEHVCMARFLVAFYMLTILITCVTTYYGCIMFPGASRQLAAADIVDSPFYSVYQQANIGGFGFIYNLVLLAMFYITIIKSRNLYKRPISHTVISIGSLILIGMTIWVSEYTIAIIFYLASLSLLLIKKINWKILAVCSLMVVMLYANFKFEIANRLLYIAENIESVDVSTRIEDIALVMQGHHTSDESDIDKRQATYTKSLEAFMSHPFGVWNTDQVGGHSCFLDILGKYGILGLLVVALVFKKIYKYYIAIFRHQSCYMYIFIMYVLFIVLSVLNPRMLTTCIMFVVPVYFLAFKKSIESTK